MSMSYAVRDAATMFRRNLKHQKRYPSMTLIVIGMPVVFLLLFVYVFGGTLGAGLGGVAALPGTASAAAGGSVASRADYLAYVLPGILAMTVAATAQGTAIAVAMDMTEGIIDRFRTMSIARSSVLTGHVLGSMVQAYLGLVVVFGVALAIGFRTSTDPLAWLAAAGMAGALGLALTWVSVALGMASKSVESASNVPMPMILLPFLGSGFVPTESMPTWLRWFAEYQPFTPVIDTLRGLLVGGPIGWSAVIGLGWCAGLSTLGYAWARRAYDRAPARQT